jgi:hypothetical protein
MAKAWMFGAALVLVGSAAHAQDAPPAPPAPVPVVDDDAAPRALYALIADEAASERRARRFAGWMTFGFGAGLGVAGTALVAFPDSLDPNHHTVPQIVGGGLIGIGALAMILGAVQLAVPTAVETLATDYARTMKDDGLSASTKLTIGETRLRVLAETQRAARKRGAIFSIVVGSVVAPAGIALGLVSPFPRPFAWAYGGLFGTLGFLDVFLGVWSLTIRRDPAERLLHTWLLGTGRGDSGLTVSPQLGGGLLGWHGTF